MYGYMGKILQINLTNSEIKEIPTEPYVAQYLGGRGIASRIYWETITPKIKAFEEENRLIFISGLLVGTGAQAATRMSVIAKSPMAFPEGYCFGNIGGHFPAELKCAGFDGIVVDGRAPKPVYLWITDNKAEIRDASALWGQGAYRVGELLQKEHGEKARYITTGVAGENRVRAAVITGSNESSSTGGFAAVMGSKKLKAVAVIGTGKPSVADPDRLKALNRYTAQIGGRVLEKRFVMNEAGQKVEIEGVERGKCSQCGMECIRRKYRFPNGREVIGKCQAQGYYMPWKFGRENEPVDTFADAPVLANDYSLCTKELNKMINWLNKCHQSGILSEKETGLPLSKIGTRAFLEKLLHAIAYREGFGDILAEGLVRAREAVSSEARSLTPSNLIPIDFGDAYSPRIFVVHSLLNPMEPRGHIPLFHHLAWTCRTWEINREDPERSPVTTDVFRAIAKAFWGSEEAGNVISYEGKALAAKLTQDRMCVYDGLGLCDFTWPIAYSFNTPDHLGDSNLEAKIYTAVTGKTGEALYRQGESIFHLQRVILLREGRKVPEADFPPEYLFTEPQMTHRMGWGLEVPGPGGKVVDGKGSVLDKEKYAKMLKEYYRLRGWDEATGLPLPETLENLGLHDLASRLKG